MFIWVDWNILKICNVFEIVKNYLDWEWSNADVGAVLPSSFNIYRVRARVDCLRAAGLRSERPRARARKEGRRARALDRGEEERRIITTRAFELPALPA